PTTALTKELIMRVFGPRTSMSVFRWDLVYLAAQLVSDDRPGVAALAPPIQSALASIAAERASMEQAEDGSLVAIAQVRKRDKKRDALLVTLGGVARATDKPVYGTLFPTRSPAIIARLGVDAESAEVERILGELSVLPMSHPLRLAYEKDLDD